VTVDDQRRILKPGDAYYFGSITADVDRTVSSDQAKNFGTPKINGVTRLKTVVPSRTRIAWI
jgi:hypothetical protein